MNVLFATSELYPLIKTGGLADVSYSLPLAMSALDKNITIVLPGYRSVIDQLGPTKKEFVFNDLYLRSDVTLQQHQLPSSNITLLLVCSESLFDREGGPYVDAEGNDWHDNADRFSQFCRAVVNLLNPLESPYPISFDLVHCNDWQTGLVPAFVALYGFDVKSVFTIHNLAYQGVFDRACYDYLSLPPQWWSYEYLEFYDNFSFLKAGVVFSDWVTTVSPTYAREILHEPLACGMSGLLKHYQHKLVGILNGADYEVWNPQTDPHIKFHYSAQNLENKTKNKLDLQRQLGLRLSKSAPLVGAVSRLVHQKGMDWLVETIQNLQDEKVQWVILGSGDPQIENQLLELARANPKTVSVTVGYNETLAHQIEAGSDLFVMPSRYEPCGLNQIYSLRYGTLPIVRATGGLIDTVVDVDEDSIKQETCTGFVFEVQTTQALQEAVCRAIAFFSRRKAWNKIQQTAMKQNFDWGHSAQSYIELYQQAGKPL